jgi:hypothetical protein
MVAISSTNCIDYKSNLYNFYLKNCQSYEPDWPVKTGLARFAGSSCYLFHMRRASLASAKRNSHANFGGNAIFVLILVSLLMETAAAILMIN